GLVEFEKGMVGSRWQTLANPGCFFDPVNVSIHKIEPDHVSGAPVLRDVMDDLSARIRGKVVVAHSGFDRMAITRACGNLGLEAPNCRWIDTATVARRTWEDVSKKGYGLASLAARLGIEFRHHDAGEDAFVAGHVLVQAIQDSGKDLDWWLKALNSRRKPRSTASLPDLVVNENGPLYGEVVAFTGALSSPRAVAEAKAMSVGCVVSSGVNKTVTILVVGDQDITKMAPGQTRSTKHRKAEDMIAKGFEIRIIGESDFDSMVESTDAEE